MLSQKLTVVDFRLRMDGALFYVPANTV